MASLGHCCHDARRPWRQMRLGVRIRRRLRRLQARLLRSIVAPIQPLAFLHVPKSAGTAFTSAIAATLLPGRMVTGFDRSTFGDFTRFDTLPGRTRRRIYLTPSEIPCAAEFLSGHFAKTTVDIALPGVRQMMLLREPSARVLSQWAYWRALPDEKHREWGAWSARIALARRPLACFLADPSVACQTDNAYVRALLWPHELIPNDGFIPDEADAVLVPAALIALESLAFAGILEDPGMIRALEDFLGCRLKIRALNVTQIMPEFLQTSMKAELTDEALHLVQARARLDRQLWQALAQRLMPAAAVGTLQATTFERTHARYAELMQ